jgi:hypothetical protein
MRRAARELAKTKARLGLGPNEPLHGFVPSPLATSTWTRGTKLPRTSDRIPASAPSRSLMHDYKWRRGAEEAASTVEEIRRKSARIAPTYNKGALQYLPDAAKKRKG